MNRTLRILHLEDLPSDAELIERLLQKSGLVYEKLLVDNRDAYTNALSSFAPDIILSDHALPSFNSAEALKLALGSLVTNENVTIKTDFSALMNTYTLKSYLYNIFYALILNSINFKQPLRPPVIEIKSHQNGLNGIVVFKDNGRGINLAKYGRQIFGLYQRFDTSVEGRGMGLCMAKTQVETLGGTISVVSQVGKGTTFTVELPV